MKLIVRTFSLWLLVWFSSAASLHAHGGAPSALGVVAADARGPRVVVLNEGLAQARGGRWSFLCPSLWGDRSTSAGKVPLALSADGRSSWIIGADDLYLAQEETLEPQGRPDLSSNRVLALAVVGTATIGLRIQDRGSELVWIGATEEAPIWGSAEYWSSLAADGERLYLARLANEREVAFVSLDLEGAVVSETRATLDHVVARVDLHPTASGLFVSMYDGNVGFTLGVIDDGRWQVVLQSDAALDGPQASSGGQLWITKNGQLMRATDATGRMFEPAGPVGQVTCLDAWGGRSYACVGSELYWLEDEGLGERFFQLDRLSGPPPELIPAAAQEECGFQWILFRNDLERSGLAPQDWITAEPPTAPMAGAGASGAPATDAGAPPTAAPQEPPEAGSERPGRRSGGCSATTPPSTQGAAAVALLCAAMTIASRRLGKRRSSRRPNSVYSRRR